MADFTGFYYDNIHSSTYHLLRVSDGDRYSEGLFPEFEDFTVELAGGNGSAYQSTRFKETEFTINVAFDHVTENDFKEIKKWLSPNKIKPFRFDERPYKTYWAKLKKRPVFEYVCFMEETDGFDKQEERIYKGEVKLEFIAYNPFGYCNDDSVRLTEDGLVEVEGGINWQSLNNYNPLTLVDDNVNEWALASGLKIEQELKEYNNFIFHEKYFASLYNPGDFNTDFDLFCSLKSNFTDNIDALDFIKKEDHYGVKIKDGHAEKISGKIVIPSEYKGLPVTELEENAFYECKNITEIELPEGLVTIGQWSFYSCNSLIYINIPDTVTTIKMGAFIACTSLKRALIGKNVGTIPSSMFSYCFALNTIICMREEPPTLDGQFNFNGVPEECVYYVPDGSIENYKKVWGKTNVMAITEEILKEDPLTIGDILCSIYITDEDEQQQFFQFSLKGLSWYDKILLDTQKHSLTVYHEDGTRELRYDLVKSTHWPTIPIGESEIEIFCSLESFSPQIKYSYKYY